MCCSFAVFFFSSRRRHTSCALVTGVQTCALPIWTLHAATKPMAHRIWLLKPCAPGVSPSAETAALQAPAKRSKDGLLGVGLIMAVLLMLRSRSVAGVALAWLGGEVLVVLACLAAMLLRDRKSTRLNSSH